MNQEYFIVNASLEMESQQDEYSAIDTAWHESGNYFGDRETAREAADCMQAVFAYIQGEKSIDRSIYALVRARDKVVGNNTSKDGDE